MYWLMIEDLLIVIISKWVDSDWSQTTLEEEVGLTNPWVNCAQGLWRLMNGLCTGVRQLPKKDYALELDYSN